MRYAPVVLINTCLWVSLMFFVHCPVVYFMHPRIGSIEAIIGINMVLYKKYKLTTTYFRNS